MFAIIYVLIRQIVHQRALTSSQQYTVLVSSLHILATFLYYTDSTHSRQKCWISYIVNIYIAICLKKTLDLVMIETALISVINSSFHVALQAFPNTVASVFLGLFNENLHMPVYPSFPFF